MAKQTQPTEIFDEDGTLLVEAQLLDGLVCGIGDGVAVASLGDA